MSPQPRSAGEAEGGEAIIDTALRTLGRVDIVMGCKTVAIR